MNRNDIHLSDQQLIEHLYGLADVGSHLDGCLECHDRLRAMQTRRTQLDQASPEQGISPQFLAAQRRAVYARSEERSHWWRGGTLVHYVSGGAAVLIFGTGLLVLQDSRTSPKHEPSVSDVELAQQVSQLSLEAEAGPTAPLKGLFE